MTQVHGQSFSGFARKGQSLFIAGVGAKEKCFSYLQINAVNSQFSGIIELFAAKFRNGKIFLELGDQN